MCTALQHVRVDPDGWTYATDIATMLAAVLALAAIGLSYWFARNTRRDLTNQRRAEFYLQLLVEIADLLQMATWGANFARLKVRVDLLPESTVSLPNLRPATRSQGNLDSANRLVVQGDVERAVEALTGVDSVWKKGK
jgi:hypothetical protein